MPHSRHKSRITQLPFPGEDVHIQLTRGYEAIVSWEDRDLAFLNWYAKINDGRPYATRTIKEKGWEYKVTMHRLILSRILAHELIPSEEVDHIDNDSLNNRRHNLRLVTSSQNNQNTPKRKDNTSGYKGVVLHKSSGLWMARITVNKIKILLGYFKTPEEAHQAYCEAAKKYFGEFARLE